MKILVMNGPNLNMLGIREPDIYGRTTYADLVEMIKAHAQALSEERKAAGLDELLVECYQSNHEGDLVDEIQKAYGSVDAIVINPGAYTHTSVAILDAVKSVAIPTVEVHISDPDTREEFRKLSYIRLACETTIKGHGLNGYLEAMDYFAKPNR